MFINVAKFGVVSRFSGLDNLEKVVNRKHSIIIQDVQNLRETGKSYNILIYLQV